MGLFSRKPGRLATIRAMSAFSQADRDQGMAMLEATEDVFVELRAPSRLGTALFTACAGSMGVDEDSQVVGVVAGASLMGYACRMATPARELPDNLAGAIGSRLLFTKAGELDYDALADDPERFGKLCELTAAVADDPAAIAALADVTTGAWQTFATTATFQLHKNLVASGLSKRALPSREALENLLRLGYAIRLVDEVAGEQPGRKDELLRGDDQGEPVEPDPVVIERQNGRRPQRPSTSTRGRTTLPGCARAASSRSPSASLRWRRSSA